MPEQPSGKRRKIKKNRPAAAKPRESSRRPDGASSARVKKKMHAARQPGAPTRRRRMPVNSVETKEKNNPIELSIPGGGNGAGAGDGRGGAGGGGSSTPPGGEDRAALDQI